MKPRSERSRNATRRLTEAVARVAPTGLGRWDRAWEVVAEPSRAYLDAIVQWENAPEDGPDEVTLRKSVKVAADAVIAAWAEAAQQWAAAGRPVTWSESAREAVHA